MFLAWKEPLWPKPGEAEASFYRRHASWAGAMAAQAAAEGEPGSAEFWREEAESDRWMAEQESMEVD
jgi:hypothetical protein